MTLVVVGHTIRPFTNDNALIQSIYLWIYFFHMPAFILISGYFSKGFNKRGYYKKQIFKLLFPYIIFETIYSGFISLVFNKKFELSLLTPYWLLWFLISLFLWQVMLKIFTRISYSLFWAIALSLAAGYIEFLGKELSLMRTLVFFPVFYIGYMLEKKHFEKLKQVKFKIIGTLMLFSTFVYIEFVGNISLRMLWGSKPYSVSSYAPEEAWLIKLIYFLVSMLMTLSFFTLVTDKRKWYSHMGIYTFFTYLLHGFIIRLLVYKLHLIPDPNSVIDYMILIIFSIGVCLLTTSKPVRFVFRPLLEPVQMIKHAKKSKTHHYI